MEKLRSLCIFAGSSSGIRPEYFIDAVRLGEICAENDITLVYGGGSKGLMGAIAKEVKRKGGRTIGVLPKAMNLPSIRTEDVETELIIVDDMHARKDRMYALSDAFIALPGGIGTLEEFSEIFTWRQLGIHKKNVALLNTSGYYDSLLKFLEKSKEEGFLSHLVLDELIVINDVEDALSLLCRDARVLPDKI